MTGLAPDDITRMRDQLFFDGPERNRRLSRFWLLLLVLIGAAAVVGVGWLLVLFVAYPVVAQTTPCQDRRQ